MSVLYHPLRSTVERSLLREARPFGAFDQHLDAKTDQSGPVQWRPLAPQARRHAEGSPQARDGRLSFNVNTET